ncbi:hypothetical protein MRB53_001580 [Persea americana]|uniref:Uncharacterized protein n=1 Tax=Persea americana TaxID=3435 RepID=A0ACC2MUF9_PERAE|nr:hypothetical protein MRB53_001580 [Persea americana]
MSPLRLHRHPLHFQSNEGLSVPRREPRSRGVPAVATDRLCFSLLIDDRVDRLSPNRAGSERLHQLSEVLLLSLHHKIDHGRSPRSSRRRKQNGSSRSNNVNKDSSCGWMTFVMVVVVVCLTGGVVLGGKIAGKQEDDDAVAMLFVQKERNFLSLFSLLQ